MHTYTALFDSRQDAEAAQAQLQKIGIVATGMNLVSRDTQGFKADRAEDNRGFWSSLKDVFVSDDDRDVYDEGVRQGSWLLTVNVDDASSDRVHDVLESSKAVNVDEREQQYRAANTLRSTSAKPATAEQAIPIVQEQVRVGKRRVEKGGVRVRSYMVSTPVHENVNLREEHVSVERRAVDHPVTASNLADGLRDRTVEVTASKEEAVVAKDARIVEEVVVKKTVGEHVERVDETVRHTEVDVQRVAGDTQDGAKGTRPTR